MSSAGRAQPWMTRGLAIGLVVVSALSLLAFLVLNAFAPELRGDQTGGGNVLSKSAVGFAGLQILLDGWGEKTLIDRGEESANRKSYGLTILTPEWTASDDDLAQAARSGGPHLIVLPKRLVVADPAHPGWVMNISDVDTDALANLLGKLSKTTKIARRNTKANVTLSWYDPSTARKIAPAAPPLTIDSLQTLSGKDWHPMLVDEKGETVVALLAGTQIYVAADPDFLNTQGLHDPGIARLAPLIIAYARGGDGPIAFDVTLNGFRATPDLMREAFSPPFLGATLCALLAAALLGFHAVSRFGTPRPPERAIAFGKRALADSTAGLIRMLGREPAMAPRYAATLKNLVLKYLGAPRETRAGEQWLARAEKGKPGPGYAQLLAEAEAAGNVTALMKAARELYRWKRGIMNERV